MQLKSTCGPCDMRSRFSIERAKHFARNWCNFSRGGGHSHIGSYQGCAARMGEFPGQKPADGCKFLTKNLRMDHNFDITLPGNGWFSSELNKTCCSVVSFCFK